MKAIADMRLLEGYGSNNNSLMAVGNVTINELITIKGVKFMEFPQEDGTKKAVVLLPRREVKKEDGKSDWKPVFDVTKEMKAEIDRVVGESMKGRVVNELHKPEIEVSVTPYQDSSNGFLGYASIKFDGALTIKGVRIYENRDGEGIRLSYPSDEKNKYGIVAIQGSIFKTAILEKTQEAYEEAISAREQQRGKSL
ncbi:MAG: SpoVG family protein [Clostridiales bacterium]|nr:SpoVG family protein [Clostridiales bacterium]